MSKPNFLIIGAIKGGTTAINQYLKQHPEIYMASVKEPNFFLHDVSAPSPRIAFKSWSEYFSLFKSATNEKIIGEASPSYLHSPYAYERIATYSSNVKLLATLRDPSDRAYSHFLMLYRDKLSGMNESQIFDFFSQMLEKDDRIFSRGLYYKYLSNYLSVFDKKQIKVCLYSELKDDVGKLLKSIYQFLDVDDSFQIGREEVYYNKGGIPKNSSSYIFLDNFKSTFNKYIKPALPEKLLAPLYESYNTIRNSNLTKAPLLKAESRSKLIGMYQEDILSLQDLLEVDLSAWLGPKNSPRNAENTSESM